MTLTVGSLFSGIGGIDLGLERAGMKVIWQSEINPYAAKVLAKHWPTVPNLGDVTKIDWSGVERPDLICGGFPCQPVSVAGRGLAQADERWLWPEYARAVRHLRPDHVLVENVPGLLIRGVGDVLGDLATLGYDTEWESLPAAAFGAPHLRWRVFFVAHSDRGRCRQRDEGQWLLPVADKGRPYVADADRAGLGERRWAGAVGAQHLAAERGGEGVAHPVGHGGRSEVFGGEAGGALAFGPTGGPGGPGWWAVEPDVGRVVNGVPFRVDRLRCLGNGVVPQVAEYVGRLIAAHNDGGERG